MAFYAYNWMGVPLYHPTANLERRLRPDEDETVEHAERRKERRHKESRKSSTTSSSSSSSDQQQHHHHHHSPIDSFIHFFSCFPSASHFEESGGEYNKAGEGGRMDTIEEAEESNPSSPCANDDDDGGDKKQVRRMEFASQRS